MNTMDRWRIAWRISTHLYWTMQRGLHSSFGFVTPQYSDGWRAQKETSRCAACQNPVFTKTVCGQWETTTCWSPYGRWKRQ